MPTIDELLGPRTSITDLLGPEKLTYLSTDKEPRIRPQPEVDEFIQSPVPNVSTAPFQPESGMWRTEGGRFQKTKQTKREALREAISDEPDEVTSEKLLGQLSVSPLEARAGLKQTLAGILRAVNAPPILSWIYSKSAEQDAEDADEFSKMIGGGKAGQTVKEFGSTAIQSLPALAAAPAGLAGMAITAGAQTFGSVTEDAYQTYKAKDDPDALKKARLAGGLAGVVTAGLTRYIPGGTERFAEALVRGELKQIAAQGVIKSILKEAAQEFPEEALDQVSQGVIAKFSYRPETTWSQIGEDSVKAGLTGSALAGLVGGATIPVSKGVSRLRRGSLIRESISTDQPQDFGEPLELRIPDAIPIREAFSGLTAIPKVATLAVDETQPNELPAGTQAQPGINREAAANDVATVARRNAQTANTWLEGVERNNTEAIQNAEAAMLREPFTPQIQQQQSVLGDTDVGGTEIRAPGNYGGALRAEAAPSGARSSQKRGRIGQPIGEFGTTDALSALSASWQNAGNAVSEASKRAVGEAVQLLYDMRFPEKQARSARDLRSLLQKELSTIPTQEAEIIRSAIYATIFQRAPIISGATVAEVPEGNATKAVVASVLEQDIAREKLLNDEMAVIVRAKDYQNPRLMSVQQEIQDLKNKYQGRKPSDIANEALPVAAPVPEPAIAGRESGQPAVQKFRVGKSPQTFTLVRELPQSEIERVNNEQPVEVRNDKTGEVQTVLKDQLTPVQTRPKSEPQQPSLYREASASDVDSYVNPATDASTPFGVPEIFTSTSRDLALGQGQNKSGIVVEFDPSGLDVRAPRQSKPGAAFVEQQGGGAERVIRAQPTQLRNKVRSITIPNVKSGRDVSLIRLRRYLDAEWDKKVGANETVYRPRTKQKVDLDAELRAVGLEPSVFPNIESKKEALKRQKAKSFSLVNPISETDTSNVLQQFQSEVGPSEVEVVNDPNWTVGNSGVQGTVRNGRIVLNRAFVRNPAEALQVLREERAHLLLGTPEAQAQLLQIAQRLDPVTLDSLRRQYGNDQAVLINEWAAKTQRESPTLWQRFVQSVMELLAKAGLVKLTPTQAVAALFKGLTRTSEGNGFSLTSTSNQSAMSVLDDYFRNSERGKRQLSTHIQYEDDVFKIVSDEAYLLLSDAMSRNPNDPVSVFEWRERNYGIPKEVTAAYIRVSNALSKFQFSPEAVRKINDFVDQHLGSRFNPLQYSLLEESEEPSEGGLTVNIAGRTYNVVDKDRLTPEQRAAGDARAQSKLKELGLPGAPDTTVDRRAGSIDNNTVWKVVPDGVNHDSAGVALRDHLIEQVQMQNSVGGDAAYVSSLINAINMNFDFGNWRGVLSQPVLESLLNVSVGESSRRGTLLRQIRGISNDIRAVAQNASLRLKWVYSKAFDPDGAAQSAMKTIQELFRAHFTDATISDALNRNALGELFGKLTLKEGTRPSVDNVVKDVFNTPVSNTKDLSGVFINKLNQIFNITDSQKASLTDLFNKSFSSDIQTAKDNALKAIMAELSGKQGKLKTPRTLAEKIEKIVNEGALDDASLFRRMAKDNGWEVPSDKQVEEMREWATREQKLQEPTAEEIAKFGGDVAAAKMAVESATLDTRRELLRKMNTQWSKWTQPLVTKWRDLADPEKVKNTNTAFNEWVAANLLLKVGFGVRQVIDVGTQMILNTPTRALGYAFDRWSTDKSSNRDSNLQHNIAEALIDAYRTRLKVIGYALNSFKQTIKGRGEQKQVEQLISSIGVFDRMLMWASTQRAEGKRGAATLLEVIAITMRMGRQFAAAMDVVHGIPAEAQEIAHLVRNSLSAKGLGKEAVEVQFNNIIGILTAYRAEALSQAREMLELRGEDTSSSAVERAAWHILRSRIYHAAQQAGLSADEWKKQNATYRDLIGWNLPETGGMKAPGGAGGLVALGGRAAKEAFSRVPIIGGILSIPFTFSNAMGISMNRKLAWSPLGFFPGIHKGSPHWEGAANIRQRKLEAVLGTGIHSIIFTLIISGVWKALPSFWPKDEKEREEWVRNGWSPGMVIVPWGNNEELHLSTRTGPLAFFAPSIAAAAAYQQKTEDRAKKQKTANDRAAKLGIPAEQIPEMTVGDWMGVMGNAAYASLTGGRTASGALASYTDFGDFNIKKATASLVSGFTPGVPAINEFGRLAGANINPKLASFWDLLVPMPTSDAQRVNMLGDPMKDENDYRRVFTILSGGNFPFPSSPTPMETQAYTNLFTTDFRPPTINPTRGYQIGGKLRPFNESELEIYTRARGQEFKTELASLGANPTEDMVKEAFTRANQRALRSVGVMSSRKLAATPRRTRTRSLLRGRGLRLRGVRRRSLRLGRRRRRLTLR